MGFLAEYGLFIAKSVTVLIFVLLLLVAIVGVLGRKKQAKSDDTTLEVHYLNSELAEDKLDIEYEILDKAEKKKLKKQPIKPEKDKPRLFVIDFDGDIHASEVEQLRRQITAVINTAKTDKDKVLLRLESPGGVVHGYGLAASQLNRLREANVDLTVAVDKVAASGGYMMACVANQIVAAPFSVVGSIGVVAQIPNVNRLLKDKNIDIEMHTAGKYKRTLTMLGENDDEGRAKFVEELELTHQLFKTHINKFRPQIDIETIATGETWYGQQALDNGLVDKIKTSDDLIIEATKTMDVYRLEISHKQSLVEKLKSQFLSKNKAQISNHYLM